MNDALAGVCVLRQLYRLQTMRPSEDAQHRGHVLERIAGGGEQLPRLPRVADVVRPLAKETDASIAHVQTLAHAGPVFPQRGNFDVGGERERPAHAAAGCPAWVLYLSHR